MNKEKTPNPGSNEARKMSCRCPVLDNGGGLGAWGGAKGIDGEKVFWINNECPLHGEPSYVVAFSEGESEGGAE